MSNLVVPAYVQLSRAKGWRLADASQNPNGVVNCARPHRHGNPFKVVPVPRSDEGLARLANADRHIVCDPATAVHLYEEDLEDGKLPYTVEDVRRDLAGKDLACWCPEGDGPCHVQDVLLPLANGWEMPR